MHKGISELVIVFVPNSTVSAINGACYHQMKRSVALPILAETCMLYVWCQVGAARESNACRGCCASLQLGGRPIGRTYLLHRMMLVSLYARFTRLRQLKYVIVLSWRLLRKTLLRVRRFCSFRDLGGKDTGVSLSEMLNWLSKCNAITTYNP